MRALVFALTGSLLLACSDDTAVTGGSPSTGGAGGSGAGNTGGSGGAGAATEGGGGSAIVPDGVVIAFPPPISLTDRDTITVRGTASLDAEISSLTVDGVEATSEDGFVHWSAVVPLSLGAQTLAVEVVGPSLPDAPSVSVDRRATLGRDAELLAVDELGGRAFTATGLGGFDNVIVSIDLSTGEQAVLSSATVGAGPEFDDQLFTLSWDDAGQRLLAFDTDELWAIDGDTGAREILFSKPAGGPPWPSDDNEAEVDSAQNRIIASTDTSATLIALDLTTFSITILSGNGSGLPSVGAGPEINDAQGMALDLANNRAFVVDDWAFTGLATIDLSTGDRAIVSSPSLGSGPWAALPDRVAFEGGTVWVSGKVGSDVFAVDLATGNRSLVMAEQLGTGELVPYVTALEHDGQSLLVTSPLIDALVRIDPATFARTVVSSYSLGAGQSLWEPFGIAWDAVDERFAAVDFGGVVTIDPANGGREVLSSYTLGVGGGLPGLGFSTYVEVTTDAFVGFSGAAFVRVDRATGDRTVLSGVAGAESVGSGPQPVGMRAFTASADGTALWLIDLETTVMRVDVDTGDRVVVSSATVGMGPTLSAPRDLVHDPDNDRLIVSTDTGAIVAIDLATGDRSEISGPNVGEGPLAVGEVFLRPEGLYLAYNHIWSLVDLDTGDRARVVEGGVGPGLYGAGYTIAPDGLFYATDPRLGAVLATDPVSGERVIVSR
jgi:hypothetical protein